MYEGESSKKHVYNGFQYGYPGFEEDNSIEDHLEFMEDIRGSLIFLNAIFDYNPDPWYLYDLRGRIIDCNRAFEELLGHKKQYLIGRSFLSLKMLPLIQRARAKIILDKNASGIASGPDEFEFIRKDGNIVNVEVKTSLIDIKDHKLIIATARDVEQHLQREETLRMQTESREELVEEVYRQIEKNLQIVTSLMNLQKAYLGNEEDAQLLQDTHNRVKSIRKAYEKLHHSPELTRINFAEYSKSIISGLLSTYAPEPGNVALKINIDEIFMGLDTAIPMGMIISELVSNSFCHAFDPNIYGEIKIDFKAYPDHYKLIVSDDGKGFPEDVEFGKTSSLGLLLVKSLVDQIDAKMNMKLNAGTCFKIKAPRGDNKQF
jgi:PAS domain S-box-containing protein